MKQGCRLITCFNFSLSPREMFRVEEVVLSSSPQFLSSEATKARSLFFAVCHLVSKMQHSFSPEDFASKCLLLYPFTLSP